MDDEIEYVYVKGAKGMYKLTHLWTVCPEDDDGGLLGAMVDVRTMYDLEDAGVLVDVGTKHFPGEWDSFAKMNQVYLNKDKIIFPSIEADLLYG